MSPHTSRLFRFPILAVLLLCSTGCITHWETRDLYQLRRADDVSRVRITQGDRQTVLNQPRFVGDSILGSAIGPEECTRTSFTDDRFGRFTCRRPETPMAIALGSVDRLEAPGIDEVASVGVGLGAVAGVLFLAWRITCQGNSFGC